MLEERETLDPLDQKEIKVSLDLRDQRESVLCHSLSRKEFLARKE